MIRFRWHASLALAGLVVTSAGIAGCVTETQLRSKPIVVGDGPPPKLADGEPLPTRPAGQIRTTAVRTAVLPLGTVAYDNFSLPLIAPGGNAVATENGVPPEWSTVLAEPEAPQPLATAVEIYRVDYPNRSVEPAITLTEPVLLGRACDREGFLVELQRTDGSRAIGKADWSTGAIEWLVDDSEVNAFATLGPHDTMAWSRCSVDADYFDLVIADPAGRWSVDADGGHWLFPTFSGKGDTIYVLRLVDRQLDLVHAVATNAQTFAQSMRRIPISSNGSLQMAYQATNGQPTMITAKVPQRDRLVFFHTGQGRAAVWQPYARSTRSAVLLAPGSLTGLVDDTDFALVPTNKDLLRQSLMDLSNEVSLLRGLLIPRATDRTDWPYIMLTPIEGEVGLTALQLEPQVEPQSP